MKFPYTLISISTISIILYSCFESETERSERLAKTYCSACHLFPEPYLLDKATWEKGVMPRMAFRMGLDNFGILEIPAPDHMTVASTIPSAMVSMKDWELIKKYYQINAPDSLTASVSKSDSLEQFKPVTIKFGDQSLMVTLLQSNPKDKSLWIGTRQSKLYNLDSSFKINETFDLKSPPSQLQVREGQLPLVLQMGIMDPNDQPAGSFVRLETGGTLTHLIDSLKRPVFFESTDLNNDNKTDYIICSFGNFTGSLTAYENLGDDLFKNHIITRVPGSRKVIAEDFDGDGDIDIMALLTQGDEKIQLFLNKGNFEFESKTLLRFPPVYGSNYFELIDFNGDGKKDILYSNGDNADYSIITKPYHGLRIYINQGDYKFEEKFFYPLSGASQTITFDFDTDGDLDIAAISFFPNFKGGQNGFVYLENTDDGLQFKPYTSSMASIARWLRMEMADINQDGKQDLILGSLNFPIAIERSIYTHWNQENVTLLVLYNK